MQKQGQKLVLSDALAVQSQGPKVVFRFWKMDLKKWFEISKNVLGSQKMVVDIVEIVDNVEMVDNVEIVDNV